MAPLSHNRDQREFEKFELNSQGETAVNVIGEMTGEFTTSGLKIAMRVTTMNVTSVAAPIPGTALTARNSITIENFSSEIVYVNQTSSVTADRALGTTAGHEIPPGNGFNIDITDDIILHAICVTGPALVKVTELA